MGTPGGQAVSTSRGIILRRTPSNAQERVSLILELLAASLRLAGFEVARRLRSGGARTPVLFLTARDAKPFSLEEVSASSVGGATVYDLTDTSAEGVGPVV